MSRIHTFEARDHKFLRMVIHIPVGEAAAILNAQFPENVANKNHWGKTWKNVGLASGNLGSTTMAEGNLPGQISAAEKAEIEAANVLEISVDAKIDLQQPPDADDLDTLATRAVNQWVASFGVVHNFYGQTQD